jgi:hypothetical protein
LVPDDYIWGSVWIYGNGSYSSAGNSYGIPDERLAMAH